MKKIGICGGIGSGKSVVSRILKNFGFPVYDSDFSAKQLMNKSESIRKNLIEKFGSEVYSGVELNRQFLAQQIFGDEQNRVFVNRLVHPVVVSDFQQWSFQQNSEIVFIESAILYESKIAQLLDASIFVDAPLEIRVERIVKRNNCTEEEALARISVQDTEQNKKKCRFIIKNDNKNLVTKQLLSLLKNLV